MEISINTAGATKRELLLVAGLFTSLAEVTEYARTTHNHIPPATLKGMVEKWDARDAASISQVDRPDVGAPEAPIVPSVPQPPVPDLAAGFGQPLPTSTASVPVAVPLPPTAPPVPHSPAPTLPSAATAPTVALDVRGLPWDDRIHSSGEQRKNADGRWKKRKGVDDLTVARVEAELLGQTVPAAATPVPPPPPAFIPGAGAPVVPGHGASVPPVPPAPGGMVTDYMTLQAEVIKLMTIGKLDPVLMQTLCQGVGVENLGLMGLPTNVDKIPALWAAVREQVGV